ncbi:MAG: DUF6691 family protein [Paracoccaceae bacterium]
MRLAIVFLIGVIFGTGITVSGMANPAKVLNFFDVAGGWDPSLIFVMGGALVTTFLGYKLVSTRDKPLLETGFRLPNMRNIDLKLVGGSALFGIGWGLAGFCPGGALPALGTGRWEVFAFTGALVTGIILAKALQSAAAKRMRAAT